jgi:hypothetical protein
MELIAQVNYGYSFYKKGEHYYLSVTCGTTAVFEVSFDLNAKEEADYLAHGISSIESLAGKVCYDPEAYFNRK